MLILIFIFMYKQIDNLVNSLQNNGLLFEKVDDIILSFKEKIKAFLFNPGIILSLSIFFIEMVLYTNIFSFLTGQSN